MFWCLLAQFGPVLGPGQNGPKSPKPGPGNSETAAGRVCHPLSRTESTLAMFGLPFRCVLTNFCPQVVPVGPIRPRLVPDCVPRSGTKNCPYLRLDWRLRGYLFPMPTPTFGGLHPSEWPKCTIRRGFLPAGFPFSRVLGCCGPLMPNEKGSKLGQKRFFHDLLRDHLGCL